MIVPATIHHRSISVIHPCSRIDPQGNAEVSAQIGNIGLGEVVILQVSRRGIKVSGLVEGATLGILDRSTRVGQVVSAIVIAVLEVIEIIIKAIVHQQVAITVRWGG